MSEYVALYRKWRPSVFADVIGQDHITNVLCGEIIAGSVSHAYLFCGSRGTGKTTCAKILAKAVNCEHPENGNPCGKCASCLAFANSYDILEMDAASNNSVDDIRNLCEKVNFMPIEMKKRVYIIDEVHMLSTGAFNALLKTLEEPPPHAMFILATTELHKIPATILSRCKRFDFHRISPEAMIPRLKQIADTENIGITNDALRLIAFLATGAMRDALSMLELFVGKTGIDREKAAAALGVVGNAPVLKLIGAIADRNCAGALMQLDDIYKASKDMGVLCSELAEMFRNLLVIKYASSSVSKIMDADPDVIIALRNCEDKFTKERLLYSLDIAEQTQNKLSRNGLSRRTVAELMIIKLCDSEMSTSPEAILERIAELELKLSQGVSIKAEKAPAQDKIADENSVTEPEQKDTPVFDEEVPLPDEPPVSESHMTENVPSPAPEKKQQSKQKSKSSANTKPEKDIEAVEMIAFGELLDEVKSKDMIIYSMLSESYADICGDVLKIYVTAMGYLMLSDDKEKTELITAIASKLLGMPVRVVFVQTTSLKRDNKPDLDEFAF